MSRIIILVAAFMFQGQTASACQTLDAYRSLFHHEIPQEAEDADFVGRVEVRHKLGHRFFAKGFNVQFRILESSTHPEQVGKNVILNFRRTSCGPWPQVGHAGYVFGTVDRRTLRGRLKVTPSMNGISRPSEILPEYKLRPPTR